jgi:hypothetical protein
MRTYEVLKKTAPVVKSYLIVRKKNPRTIVPRESDLLAWRYPVSGPNADISGIPELVFRSPEDGETWLTISEYEEVKARLNADEAHVFTTRKGLHVISLPVEGNIGWKRNGRTNHRHKVEYRSQSWVQVTNGDQHLA